MSKIGDYIIENGLEHDYEGEPEGCWCVECKKECQLQLLPITKNYVSDCCGASYTYEKPGEETCK